MARTPSFDRATVVRAARRVFWHDGYESASIPRLEEATGLSRSSLYSAFGSKRGLFDVVVQSYLDEVVRPRLAPLQAEIVDREALPAYLEGLRQAFDTAGTGPSADGCLLVNAAAGPIAQDPKVARVVADYRAELHAAIRRGVEAMNSDRSPEETSRLAELVTGLVVAGFALVRVDPASSVMNLTLALHAISVEPVRAER